MFWAGQETHWLRGVVICIYLSFQFDFLYSIHLCRITWLGSYEIHPLSRPHWLWGFRFGNSAGRYQDRLYYQSTYISTGRQRYISHVLMPWWDRYITDCKCPSIDHVWVGWYMGRPRLVVHPLSTTYSINNAGHNRVVLWHIYWFTYMMMYHIFFEIICCLSFGSFFFWLICHC